MELSSCEKRFLRFLAAGRDPHVDDKEIRLKEMEQAGLLRRIGPKPLDVVLTGQGQSFAEDL